jgi:hypothetical protein
MTAPDDLFVRRGAICAAGPLRRGPAFESVRFCVIPDAPFPRNAVVLTFSPTN